MKVDIKPLFPLWKWRLFLIGFLRLCSKTAKVRKGGNYEVLKPDREGKTNVLTVILNENKGVQVVKVKSLAGLIIVLAISGIVNAGLVNFDGKLVELQSWVGSGGNEAVLVIDWNDNINPVSFAWGFRWQSDTTATGRDMLNAVNAADNRLFEASGGFDGTGGSTTVYGLGYDVDGDGGSFVVTDEGIETGYATDSDDYYSEGWSVAGFWEYSSSTNGDNWSYVTGLSERVLSDKDWDGWSFAAAPGWYGGDPDIPVPEPMTVTLLGLGYLLLRRRTD